MTGPAISHPHFRQFLKVFGAPSAATHPSTPSEGNRDSGDAALPLPPQQIARLEERVVIDTSPDTPATAGQPDKSAVRPEAIKPEMIGLPRPTAEAVLRLQTAGLSASSDFDQVRRASSQQPVGVQSAYVDRHSKPSSTGPRIQISLSHRSAPDGEATEPVRANFRYRITETVSSKRILDVQKPVALDGTPNGQAIDLSQQSALASAAPRAVSEISQLALAFGLLANADLHKRWPVAYFDPRVTERSRVRSLFRKAGDETKKEAPEKEASNGLRAGKMIGIYGPLRRIFERLRFTKMARGKKSSIMLAVSSYAAILDVIARELVDAFSGKEDQEPVTLSERRDRI